MTESRLIKYLNKPRQAVNGTIRLTPVIISDSKGISLREQVDSHIGRQIQWWCKSGAKTQESLSWFNSKIANRIASFGNLSIYIWLGTCNLTTRDKNGYISLTSDNEDTVQFILDKYQEFMNIIRNYPQSKITFLEIPVYSIKKYNQKIKLKNESRRNRNNRECESNTDSKTDNLEDHTSRLEQQITKINESIRYLNETLGSRSPNFSLHLQNRRQRSRGSKQPTEKYYNYNLYSDGLHPSRLLARTWLKEIEDQIQSDCWS